MATRQWRPISLAALSSVCALPRPHWQQLGKADLLRAFGPEDLFNYIYAVLYSRSYRTRYAGHLKIDFPHLPLPGTLSVFAQLADRGGQLVSMHLLESHRLDHLGTTYVGPRAPEVGRVGWSDDTVWLDIPPTRKGAATSRGKIGFRGVSQATWNSHIGGYQVCEKWLKDRRGRTLSSDDIAHYQKIVVALAETMRLMGEIDEVIKAHGGWPGAFQTRGRRLVVLSIAVTDRAAS